MAQNELGNYYVGVGLDLGDFNSGMQGAIQAMQDSSQAMIDAMQAVVDQVQATAGHVGEGFGQAAAEAEVAAEQTQSAWSEAMSKISGGWNSVKAAVGGIGLAVAASLGGALEKTEQFEKQVRQLEIQTGMTVQQASAWTGMAVEFGVDSHMMTMAIRGITREMEQIHEHGETGRTVIERYGIAYKDASGNLLGTNQVMMNTADKIKDLGDSQQAAAVAMGVFGSRIGLQLLPMLRQGSEGIEKNIETMKAYGIVMNDDNDIKQAIQAQNNFKLAMLGLEMQVSEGLLPVVTALEVGISRIAQTIAGWNEATDGMVGACLQWGAALAIAGGGLAAVKSVLGVLGGPFIAVLDMITALGGTFSTFGGMVKSVMGTVLKAAWTFGSEFVIACGPIVWIITAVIAVVALLYEAWTHNFGGIREATSEWIGQVSAGLQQFWDGLVSWASGIANVLVGVGTAIWDLIHGDLQGAKNAAAKMVEGLGQIIQGFGQVTVGAVRTMIGAGGVALTGLKSLASGTVDAVKSGASSLKDVFKVPNAPNTENKEHEPEKPGEAGGGGKAGESKSNDEFETAKQQYEEDVAAHNYSCQAKLDAYHHYLDDVKKTSEEAAEFQKNLHSLELAAVKEGNSKKEADIKIAELSKTISQEEGLKQRAKLLEDEANAAKKVYGEDGLEYKKAVEAKLQADKALLDEQLASKTEIRRSIRMRGALGCRCAQLRRVWLKIF